MFGILFFIIKYLPIFHKLSYWIHHHRFLIQLVHNIKNLFPDPHFSRILKPLLKWQQTPLLSLHWLFVLNIFIYFFKKDLYLLLIPNLFHRLLQLKYTFSCFTQLFLYGNNLFAIGRSKQRILMRLIKIFQIPPIQNKRLICWNKKYEKQGQFLQLSYILEQLFHIFYF